MDKTDHEPHPAWVAGRQAGQDGLSWKTCPFAAGSPEKDEWDYGWAETKGYRAMNQGAVAKLCGEPLSACPYDQDDDMAGAWWHGWKDERPLTQKQLRTLVLCGSLGTLRPTWNKEVPSLVRRGLMELKSKILRVSKYQVTAMGRLVLAQALNGESE